MYKVWFKNMTKLMQCMTKRSWGYHIAQISVAVSFKVCNDFLFCFLLSYLIQLLSHSCTSAYITSTYFFYSSSHKQLKTAWQNNNQHWKLCFSWINVANLLIQINDSRSNKKKRKNKSRAQVLWGINKQNWKKWGVSFLLVLSIKQN